MSTEMKREELSALIHRLRDTHISKEESASIGGALSGVVLERHGLARLFTAFDDLGGESLWENSAALSAIVMLLWRKPSFVKSTQKYYAHLLREMLLLMQSRLWAKRLGLLFTLLVEQLLKRSSVHGQESGHLAVELHLIDRLVRPFDLLLERGDLLVQGGGGGEKGLWTKQMDSALWTATIWFKSIGQMGGDDFPHRQSLQRLLPLLMHLQGQAAVDGEGVVVVVAAGIGFVEDSTTVINKLLQSLGGPKEMATHLVQLMLLPDARHPFFELSVTAPPTAANNGPMLIEEVVVEEDEDPSPLKYPSIAIHTREAFTRREMADIKLTSLDCILKHLPSDDRTRLLMALLAASFAATSSSSSIEEDTSTCLRFVQTDNANQSTTATFNGDEQEAEEKEEEAFMPHYVLTRVLERLTAQEDLVDGGGCMLEALELSQSLLCSFTTKLSSASHLPSFDDVIGRPSSSIGMGVEEVEVKSVALAIALIGASFLSIDTKDGQSLEGLKGVGRCVDKLVKTIEGGGGGSGSGALNATTMAMLNEQVAEPCRRLLELFGGCPLLDDPTTPKQKEERKGERTHTQNAASLLEELPTSVDEEGMSEEEIAMAGHLLVELSRHLRRQATAFFSGGGGGHKEIFDRVYTRLIGLLSHQNSYIFLPAINALAELSLWKSDPYFGRLLDLFAVEGKGNEEGSEDAHLMRRCKLAEALSKVAKELGDFSPLYFNRLSNALLSMIRPANDELVQASALNALANLIVACRGRYFDGILHELLLCISQLLCTTTSSPIIRRAAIHLLRSVLVSATSNVNGSIFGGALAQSLAGITRQLKLLWAGDADEVVRLHAELALIEIEEALKESLTGEGAGRRIVIM